MQPWHTAPRAASLVGGRQRHLIKLHAGILKPAVLVLEGRQRAHVGGGRREPRPTWPTLRQQPGRWAGVLITTLQPLTMQATLLDATVGPAVNFP